MNQASNRSEIGKTLLSFSRKKWDLPGNNIFRKIFSRLSPAERFLFNLLAVIFIFSGLVLLWQVNRAMMVEIPTKGGSFTEGVVGTPRFINPLLSLPGSDADRDLTALIYSGLLRSTPEGDLINDLAESYEVSEDNSIFTFTLKDNIHFHDGRPVTAADVEFTILKAQDQALRSPRRINWDGVEVEVLNEREIRFTLSQPYAPFLENATLGIIPKHLWEKLSTEQFAFSFLNIEPVGSGPYKVRSVRRDSSGIPTLYNLTSFKDYALGEPFIGNIIMRFYPNEQELISAYERKQIESMHSLSPEAASKLEERNTRIANVTLPRVFGAFFNQNQASVFTNKEVREALNLAAPRERIVEEVLFGFGQVLDKPIPATYISQKPFDIEREERLEKAIALLEDNGWQLNEEGVREKKIGNEEVLLSFSISTSNVPDLKNTATILKEDWEKLGAEIEIRIFEANGDLSQNVIRPRRYDVLLFGKNIGRDLDMYPFWHSSQRNDPGFNIALYANITTDRLLEEARITTDKAERLEKLNLFEEEIKKDVPAVFIYSPEFIYVSPPKLQNLQLDVVASPSERFANIYEWYTETERVWKIFKNR